MTGGPSDMDAEILTTLNRLLATAAPMGAYSMGVVSVAAWKMGVQPDERLLQMASRAKTVEEADRIFREWDRARRARKAFRIVRKLS
jgi:hypothetical protein